MIYDASINSLAVGPAYDITIQKMDGLFGSPPVRSVLVDRLGAHGSFYGRDTYGPRTVTMTLNLKPNPTTGSTLDSLSRQLEVALVAQKTGSLQLLLDGSTKVLFCRPTLWDCPRTPANAKERWGLATAQFVAADPFIYDAMDTVVSLPSFQATGGWTFPWTFPWVFGGTATAGTLTATNQGSIESYPKFRVSGPFDVGFELRNLSTGAYLQVAMPLAPTDWVDVDMFAESILFQSASSRPTTVVQGTDFWWLPPGANTIRLSSLGATGGSALMRYRSAYISLRA